MRRALLAFAAAFVLSLGLAVPAQASGYLYEATCHPAGLPALTLATWVHQDPGGQHRWTKPWATPLHTKGTNYAFTYFTIDGGYPKGYEHPYYGWYLGYLHTIRGHWISENGHRASCKVTVW